MEWLTVTNGKESRRVRPRGLDDLLSQGWTLVGAKDPEQPQVAQDKPRTRKTKS